MAGKEDKKLEKRLKEYFASQQILIADANRSSRASISRMFTELGAKTLNMNMVPSFEQARDEIASKKPSIVITDYKLDKKCGLELVEDMRAIYPSEGDRYFILCASNASESSVAEAAEEDVDAYICKPFTPASLISKVKEGALRKIQPSEYTKCINMGKDFLKLDQFEEAKVYFEKAIKAEKKPCLAHYYMGQASAKEDQAEPAQASYENGLRINDIHYKCMTGMYELMESVGKTGQAYDIVKKIANHFPVSPQRLGRVMYLAVATRHFDDIGRYYDVFTNLDTRSDKLCKTVSAALVVCGISMAKAEKTDEAIQTFRRAVLASARNPLIIRESINNLMKFGLYEKAEEFMKLFSAEDAMTPDYKILNYRIANAINPDANLVDHGRKLIAEGIQDRQVYRIMVTKLIQNKLSKAARTQVAQAIERFPDLREELEGILAAHESAAA